MAGVAIECDLVNEKAPDVALTVLDELSKQRHAFTYKADQPVRDVKRDLRDAEAPRYRFEAHMGSLFLGVDGSSKLLDDFGRLSEQGVVSGSALRHVVVAPTKLQRTAVDVPRPLPSRRLDRNDAIPGATPVRYRYDRGDATPRLCTAGWRFAASLTSAAQRTHFSRDSAACAPSR